MRIGDTPLERIDGIYIKLEHLNPSGSIKDRIAQYMIDTARLSAGDRIIEASSGNTAISVAMYAAYLGHPCTLVIPDYTSTNKVRLMKAYGAELVLIDGNLSDCKKHAATLEGTYLDQFSNSANFEAQKIMAREVWKIHPHLVNIVTGIGTGGTLAGLYWNFPKATFHRWKCVDCPIEGVSDGVELPLKPKKCNLVIHDLNYAQIYLTKKYLAQHRGWFVGPSSAANFCVADKLKKEATFTLFVDRGDRYF